MSACARRSAPASSSRWRFLQATGLLGVRRTRRVRGVRASSRPSATPLKLAEALPQHASPRARAHPHRRGRPQQPHRDARPAGRATSAGGADGTAAGRARCRERGVGVHPAQARSHRGAPLPRRHRRGRCSRCTCCRRLAHGAARQRASACSAGIVDPAAAAPGCCAISCRLTVSSARRCARYWPRAGRGTLGQRRLRAPAAAHGAARAAARRAPARRRAGAGAPRSARRCRRLGSCSREHRGARRAAGGRLAHRALVLRGIWRVL